MDKNNKSVYTETGEYSFIITTDKNYNRWPNANLNVDDGNGHSRIVNMSVEPISDIQYKLTYHIAVSYTHLPSFRTSANKKDKLAKDSIIFNESCL